MSRCKRMAVEVSTRCLQALSGTVFSRLTLLAVSKAHKDFHRVHVDTFCSVNVPKSQTVLSHDLRWESMEYVAIPWSQLSVVYKLPHFDNIGLQKLLDVPNIEYLGVSILQSYIPADTIIPLPNLTELNLTEGRDAEPGYAKGFMSALVLCALSCLRLEYPMLRHLLFPTIGAFANRLSTLTIKCSTRGHPDNIQNILEFLSLLPRVRWLNLEDNPLETPFIIGLRYPCTASRLPRLRSLDISRCPFTPETDVSAILDMLESRCRDQAISEIPSSPQCAIL